MLFCNECVEIAFYKGQRPPSLFPSGPKIEARPSRAIYRGRYISLGEHSDFHTSAPAVHMYAYTASGDCFKVLV